MSKFCPSCGEELVDNAKFCKNCGAKLNAENIGSFKQTSQTYDVPIVENDHKIAVILGYICAVLIPLFGFIFGIYLVICKDSDSANRHGKIIIAIAVLIWIISFLLVRF